MKELDMREDRGYEGHECTFKETCCTFVWSLHSAKRLIPKCGQIAHGRVCGCALDSCSASIKSEYPAPRAECGEGSQ